MLGIIAPHMAKPAETLPLTLKYEGPDVEDGSMSIEDIVPVLQGFASAYGKIAAQQGVGVHHRIRITGVTPGSAKILLEVWEALGKMADPLTSMGVLGGGAMFIISSILGVIRIKRHVKKKPFTEKIIGQNTISISNSENVTIEIPVTVFEIYKSKLIDQDISKIAKPLQAGRIDAAEIVAEPLGGERLMERIEAREREYLDSEEISITSTKESWLTGSFNSLTKSTNSGYLYLTDGTRVFYEYAGDNPAKLHQIFGTYDGPVRIYAVAHMDENLRPVRLEITDIEKAQGELFQAPALHEPES